jgi:hypothetical protein
MAEKIAELEKIVKAHEQRILKLEKILLKKEAKPNVQTDFKGLTGGINFLISKGFLDSPKSVKEIHEELKSEGYHYPEKSVRKILSIDFMQKHKILTRIQEGKVWKYVLRK